MMTTPSVFIDPITFKTRQFVGSGFVLQRLNDWGTLPDSKSNGASIPGAHGNFDGGEDWSSAWVGSIQGYIRGATRADAIRMRTQLNRIRNLDVLTTMTVDEGAGPTSRLVSVRRVKQGDIRNQRIIDFVVDLQADDPFRYGPAVVTSTGLPVSGGGFTWPAVWPALWGPGGDPGRLVTPNAGSQPTYSLFSITGGIAGGISLIDIQDGREIRLERTIPLGSTAWIDPKTGRAWLDVEANDISGYLTKTEWWSVPAEGSRTIQTNAIGVVTGTPIITASTKPADL